MSGDPEVIQLSADNLRALAHPLRVQVLGLLRTQGPATATTLAAQLGLTSGALSYHLRQLERFGFVTDDPERGDGRDRWWRAAHRFTAFDATDFSSPELAFAGEEYTRSVDAAITASLARARAYAPELPVDWQRAFEVSDLLLRLSPEEVQQLSRELFALLRSYRQYAPGDPIEADQRVVEARFQVFPTAPRLSRTTTEES